MKSLKYLLALVVIFNLNAATEEEQKLSFNECVKSEEFVLKNVNTVSIKLSVSRDKENYNEEVWKSLNELGTVFEDSGNNLPKNDDSWIDEIQNLTRTVYDLVKDEKTIHGNLDVSLYSGDKKQEKKEVKDESDEIYFSFKIYRDEKDYNQEKWKKVAEAGIELAKYGEKTDGFDEELLSKIKETIKIGHDFAQDEKILADVLEVSA